MLSTALFAMLLSAGAQEMMIPAGTVLPVVLNETVSTARLQDNDPILFTLADDVHAGGHRGPVLIPRGSNVVGRVVKSERAGHFVGRSDLDIRVQEIITPTGEVYDGLSTKIIDVGKNKREKGEVKPNGEIQGPVHRERDTFLLLFPPTTLFQLIATPKRGPDVVLPVETRLYVKLMSPIYVESRVAAGTVTPPPLPVPRSVPQLVPQALPWLSSNSLDTLVEPVALYPDVILRDLFVACTHPLQIIEASQWLQQGRNRDGTLRSSGYNPNWDPSVQSITAYPDLLQRLSRNIDWVTNLGAAFTAQPADVMSAVQRFRMQANFTSNRSDFPH